MRCKLPAGRQACRKRPAQLPHRRALGSGGPARRPTAVRVQWRLGPRAQGHLLSALDGLALGIGLSCDILVAVRAGHLLQGAAHGGQGAKKRECAFLSRKFPKKSTHPPPWAFFFSAPWGLGTPGVGSRECIRLIREGLLPFSHCSGVLDLVTTND